jgi:HD-like signal output (HDOD) protein
VSDEPLHVLFVDDEPRLLEGIERMMFNVAEDWAVDTAPSGEEALTRLAAEDYAIIVSDMRMPGMDGATLLARVAELHPRVVRVILSGQTDEVATLRAAQIAHRFLTKPCSAEALYEVVSRTQRLVARLADPELRARLTRLGPLPTPPKIYQDLMDALSDSGVSVDVLAGIVSHDPALCAKVLQLANSSFFSRAATPIVQARQAISRIGTNVLRSVALGTSLFRASASSDARGVEELQRRAFQAAELALCLAGTSTAREEAFTGTLLCDVGLSALATLGPQAAETRLGTTAERLGRERVAFGATHAEIGAHLLDLWGLPLSIVEAAGTHHTPEDIPSTHALVAAIAHVADALVDGDEPCAAVVANYGLQPGLARLREDGGGIVAAGSRC